MKRLAVLGASGHGAVVADAALASGWDAVSFFDDGFPSVSAIGPWRVEGLTADLLSGRWDGVVVAIGDNRTRLEKLGQLAGAPIVSVTHPAAVISPLAVIGRGSVVFAGVVINPLARLGEGCIVNTSSSIDHDCVLGDGVHVSPGAHLGGLVRVGAGTWIGLGAAVRHGITIGANVMVGAGAVVVADVPDGQVVTGVPAKPREVREC